MMQTAESGHRYNLAASYGFRPYSVPGRCSLGEREMRAVVMMVADVLFYQLPQMAFIQYDHMVQQVLFYNC